MHIFNTRLPLHASYVTFWTCKIFMYLFMLFLKIFLMYFYILAQVALRHSYVVALALSFMWWHCFQKKQQNKHLISTHSLPPAFLPDTNAHGKHHHSAFLGVSAFTVAFHFAFPLCNFCFHVTGGMGLQVQFQIFSGLISLTGHSGATAAMFSA